MMGRWNDKLRLRLSLRVERGLRRVASQYRAAVEAGQDEDAPVEHAEELKDALLATSGARGGSLHHEAVVAAVVTDKRDATEVDAVLTDDAKDVVEVVDSDKVVVVVLVLERDE